MLKKIVHSYLKQPFPLWNFDMADMLVSGKLKSYETNNVCQTSLGYNTVNSYFKNSFEYNLTRFQLDVTSNSPVYLEKPAYEYLNLFYNDHGLEPDEFDDFSAVDVMHKLNNAFQLMLNADDCYKGVTTLVKSVQVLKSDDPEIDISYSHPEIPFSIFVSVCEKSGSENDLRVCESILHEAMHLNLTLVEEIVPLIVENSGTTFYSPWRDEQRPLRGVLHGVFVFSAIREFYTSLLAKFGNACDIKEFLALRIDQIKDEIISLAGFENAEGLTYQGKVLALKLIQRRSLL